MAKNTKPAEETTIIPPVEGADAPLVEPVVPPAPPVKEPPKTREKKEDTVEVPKATLEAILTSLEELKESDKKKSATIEMLESVADKARLAHYQKIQGKDGTLIKKAKVGFFNGWPIIAWAKGKDEVGFRDGRMVVSQTIKVFLDKGETQPTMEEVEYLFWAQNTSTQEGEVTARTSTSDGEFWSIQMSDGRKLTLDIRFINPF